MPTTKPARRRKPTARDAHGHAVPLTASRDAAFDASGVKQRRGAVERGAMGEGHKPARRK